MEQERTYQHRILVRGVTTNNFVVETNDVPNLDQPVVTVSGRVQVTPHIG